MMRDKTKEIISRHEPTSLDKKGFFKSELLRLLNEACEVRFSAEDRSFSSHWKDWAGEATIGTIAIVSGSIIALLAAATVSMGAGIGIGVTGIGMGIAYHQYRSKKKKNECARVAQLFQDRDFKKDLNDIADTFISLYENAIINLTQKDIKKVTAALSKILVYLMMKGKIDDIEDLLNAPTLYHLLILHGQKIPKSRIETESIHDFEFNIRGLITKPGIYDEVDEKIYVNANTRPTKYGLVCFKSAQDFEEYAELFKKGQYHALSRHETNKLLAHSIFQPTPKTTVLPEEALRSDPHIFSV